MKINRTGLFWMLGIAALLAFIIPFVFRDSMETVNQTLSLTATIISSVASLLTFLVAIFLYDKFGIETPLIEKQASIVFSLLEEMSKTSFMLVGNKYGARVQLINPYLGISFLEERYEDKLLVSDQYNNGLEQLTTIANSPFMPRLIADKVNQIKLYVITYVEEEEVASYTQINVAGYPPRRK